MPSWPRDTTTRKSDLLFATRGTPIGARKAISPCPTTISIPRRTSPTISGPSECPRKDNEYPSNHASFSHRRRDDLFEFGICAEIARKRTACSRLGGLSLASRNNHL